jgi:hypothetical protein
VCEVEDESVQSMLYRAPPGWSPPCGPDDWDLTINRNKGEPLFQNVDNPGGWRSYTFRPMFEPRGGKYICHAMPAGAVPVPINAVTAKREEGWYEFFYQGCEQENPTRENFRFGANREDLFPSDRDVKLDVTFLKKMGLSTQRMQECNALFFYQLILPIVNPAMSEIDGDTRMGYFKDVVRNTNMYAFGVKNRGGTREHVFRPTTAEAEESLVWDGIVCCNINTNIAESWMMNEFNTFDWEIVESMHFRRWLNIKVCLKQNACWTEKKKTDKGYDPTQKYCLVWDAMTHNMNQLIDKGGLDLTVDETHGQTQVMLVSKVVYKERRLTRVDSMFAWLQKAIHKCMDSLSQILWGSTAIHGNWPCRSETFGGHDYTSCSRHYQGSNR